MGEKEIKTLKVFLFVLAVLLGMGIWFLFFYIKDHVTFSMPVIKVESVGVVRCKEE